MNSYFAILPLVSATLLASLGLFTLSRNARHPVNIGFALGMINIAVIEVSNAVTLFSAPGGSAAFRGMRLSMMGESFLPVFWLVFSVAFGRLDYKNALKKWGPVFLIMGAVSIFFCVTAWSAGPMYSIKKSDGWSFFTVTDEGRYFYIYLVMGLTACLVQLENVFRSSRLTDRWKIKYIVLGVGGILAFFIYKASHALLFSGISTNILPALSSVTMISVLVMAVFIARNRLFDVDIFVSRHFVYNSFALLVVGLYLITVGLVAEGIKYFKVPFDYLLTPLFIFTAVLAFMAFFFSASIRRKAQLYINRNFYKHKYEFRDKWMESIEKISSKRSIEDVRDTIVGMIRETMGARFAELWLYDSATNEYYFSSSEKSNTCRISENHPLVNHLKKTKKAFVLFENGSGAEAADVDMGNGIKELMVSRDVVLAAPLAPGSDLVGFILQGKDISGEQYGKDDFELLGALTTQAAVQIKNIWLLQDLMAVKEMDAFSKMASFIMHDLKNLTNSLSLMSQNAKTNMGDPEFQRDAINTIDGTVRRMRGLIDKLSNVRNGLSLKKEKVDLNTLVRSALGKVSFNGGKELTITKNVEDPTLVSVDPEAMEMVLLNLITNAYEAIQAKGKIDIRSSVNGRSVSLTVSDTGDGMPDEFISRNLFRPFKSTKKSGFGIGLYQCKTIVEAHGGKINARSEEGRGSAFTINLPVFSEE